MRPICPLLLVLFAACAESAKSNETPANLPSRTYADGGADAGADVDGGTPVADCPAGSTLVKKIACTGTATSAPEPLASGLAKAPGSVIGRSVCPG